MFLLLTYSNNLVTYQTPVKVERSGNIWIDGLTDGYRWGTTLGNPAVGYTFIRVYKEWPLIFRAHTSSSLIFN